MSSIHIKLEHPEVIGLKKDILMLEKGLLETLIHAQNYNALRKREFMLKNEIKKDLNKIILLITELENEMPREELKEVLEGKTSKEVVKEKVKEYKKKQIAYDKKKREIEKQIEDIRAKLAILK